LTPKLAVALLYLSPQGGEIGEEKMSKVIIKHKGYTVVKEPMAGWYEWTMYGPADGICGGVKEVEGEFAVEFFDRSKRFEGFNEIVGFVAESIELGIEQYLAVAK
jgi:hypothetical protein